MPYLILDGKVVDTDRCREKTVSRKGKTIDLWYAGKTHDFGGNIQALFYPSGIPLWVSGVLPGNVHDLAAARENVLGVLRPFLDAMPVLADPGYEGAGHGIHVPVKKPAGVKELDIDTRARNALIRSVRCLGERGWRDIDLDLGEVRITGSAAVIGGQRIEGTTKSGRSRTVSIDAETVQVLRDHRKRQAGERLRLGPEWRGADDYVFSTTWGEPIHPDTVSSLMTTLVNTHNAQQSEPLPHARLHDLRHVHGPHLVRAGSTLWMRTWGRHDSVHRRTAQHSARADDRPP